MKVCFTLALIVVVTAQHSAGQSLPRMTGPLGVYHMSAGFAYNDSTGTDSTLVQYQFRFGEVCISNQSVDNGFNFVPELDSCTSWHPNKIYAVVQPPNEHGVYNQPADTALYAPYPQLNGPGMIQGGQRFSRLSELYGGYSGVILDDWNGDTSITRQVREAVRGKEVDASGYVHSESYEKTPYNKLICVLYGTGANPSALPVMDGLFYSYYSDQNCCYSNFAADIWRLRINYPKKDILFCIFLNNTHYGWTNDTSIHYLLPAALNSYDDGDINEVNLFAGPFLDKSFMPLNIWNEYALMPLLDSLYFPYLGLGRGKVYDCLSGDVLQGANVHVFCKGRVSGDTLLRSNQKADGSGAYEFGLWAGNRNTDSTYYWLIAEKSGYLSDTAGFWISRLDTTYIRDISLCPGIDGVKDNMVILPNPSSGRMTIKVPAGGAIGADIDIYNLLGERVYSGVQSGAETSIDLSGNAEGLYILSLHNGRSEISRKRILLLR